MQTTWTLVPIRWLRRKHATAEDVDLIYARGIEKLRQLITDRLRTLPEDSPSRTTLERLNSLPPDALLDDLYSYGNPNPGRRGCLSHDVLASLARKERPIGDPAYDHLLKCSPCWIEVRQLREGTDAGGTR